MNQKYYIVIKSFIDDTGSLINTGKRLNESCIKLSMIKPLIECGFLELEKQHELMVWAESLGFEWDKSMKLFRADLTSDGGGPLTHTVSKEVMEVFYSHWETI